MKAVVAAFNQEKALVGAFSVLTNPRMELFQALKLTDLAEAGILGGARSGTLLAGGGLAVAPCEAERRAAAAVQPRQPELQRGRALLRGHGEPGVGVIMLNDVRQCSQSEVTVTVIFRF